MLLAVTGLTHPGTASTYFFFFDQAEDGIRDHCVTGVQTCALPICDFLVFPISKTTRPEPSLTPEVLRLLGYYLAEGSAYIHNKLNQPVVSFSFSETERDYIEEEIGRASCRERV